MPVFCLKNVRSSAPLRGFFDKGAAQSRVGRRRAVSVATALVVASLTLAGCNSPKHEESVEDYHTPDAGATSYPVTIKNCGMDVTVKSAPRRVVVLNGASVGEVESLLALGLGDKIVGNFQNYGVSDKPGVADEVKRVKTLPGADKPNSTVSAEEITAAKPDLVVSTWAGGFDPANGSPSREQLEKQGIATYVNPGQCDAGKGRDGAGTHKDSVEGSKDQGINASFRMIEDFGTMFDVQRTAKDVISGSLTTIKDTKKAVDEKGEGRSSGKGPSALIAYPGMAAMNAHGLPVVMTGGIYDSILSAAGARNAVTGGHEATMNLTKEKLATAKVDVLVIGQYSPEENPEAEAEKLFKEYPQWEASKKRRWVSVSDSIYYGPYNDIAVKRIAAVAHPGAGVKRDDA